MYLLLYLSKKLMIEGAKRDLSFVMGIPTVTAKVHV